MTGNDGISSSHFMASIASVTVTVIINSSLPKLSTKSLSWRLRTFMPLAFLAALGKSQVNLLLRSLAQEFSPLQRSRHSVRISADE